jgi:hypothetical protein
MKAFSLLNKAPRHEDERDNGGTAPHIIGLSTIWRRQVARIGEGRGVYRVFVGRPEGKRPLGRPRRRWEVNIKMDLREIGIDGSNCIQLAQDSVQRQAFVNTVMNLRVP